MKTRILAGCLVSFLIPASPAWAGRNKRPRYTTKTKRPLLTNAELERRNAVSAPLTELATPVVPVAETAPTAECEPLLTTTNRRVADFLETAIALNRASLLEHDLFPAAIKKVEAVAQIGDTLLVKQGGQLKLTRMNSLSPKDAHVLTLEGVELIKGWKTGDFIFLRIRRGGDDLRQGAPESRPYSEILYIVPPGLGTSRQVLIKPETQIMHHPLPGDAGEYLTLGAVLWIISRIPAGEKREAQIPNFISERFAFGELWFPGFITHAVVRRDLNLPILQVDHEADHSFRPELLSSFVDYDLRARKADESLLNFELFQVPATADLAWTLKLGDRREDFAVGASWFEGGEQRNRVYSVTTSDPRKTNHRLVRAFDLPKRRFGKVTQLEFKKTLQTPGFTLTNVNGADGGAVGRPTALLSLGTSEVGVGATPGLEALPRLLENLHTQTLPAAHGDLDFHVLRTDPGGVIDESGQVKSQALATEKPLEYHVIRSPRQRHLATEALTFNSNAVWLDFTLKEPGLELFPPDTLFSLIDVGSGRTPIQAVLQTRGETSLALIPGYRGAKAIGADRVVLIYGEVADAGPVQRYFAIYDVKRNRYLHGTTPFNTFESQKLGVSITDIVTSLQKKTSLVPEVVTASPFAADLSEITTRIEAGRQILWVEGKSRQDERKNVSLRIDLDHQSVQRFDDVRPLPVTIANGAAFGAESPAKRTEFFTEHKTQRTDGKLTETTTITAILPHGEVVQQTVDGEILSAELREQGSIWKIVGRGEVRLVSRTLPTEVHWAPLVSKSLVQRTNMREHPLYADDEIRFLVSDAYLSEPPKVFYTTKEIREPHEIDLTFEIEAKQKSRRGGLAEYLALMFGLNTEDTATPRNENEIDQISRDQDLFFISTKSSAHSPSKTYVWSLRTQALLFTITNLRTYRDVGNLRFYVGQATSLNDTTVAVFDRLTHQFITYFNFRKLRLATEAGDFIRLLPGTKQIAFKTEGGLTRVFDEAQNTFVGLLPDHIMDKLKQFETDMGNVLNQTVFMEASEPLYERDDVIHDLATGLVPNADDRVIQDTLVVAAPGAGIDHVTEEFMNRWISGQIPQSAAARLIFLSLDSGRLNSNVSYRGQFADKISNLRRTATELKGLGYQIVLSIKNLEAIDHTPHNFGEGDLFSSVYNLSHDRVLSVFATVSPAGFELLSRQKPQFMSLFQTQRRLDPMSRDTTRRAVQTYVRDKGRPRLSGRQIEVVINQVQRLQQQRQLPSPAFRVVKSLAGENDPEVTDGQIQRALARVSGIPAMLLDEANFARHYDQVIAYLNRRVVGQPRVIQSVVDAVFAFAQGTNRADLPIARVMLPGMTGTGKTELARGLTAALLPDPKTWLKIDGATYSRNQDPLGLTKIIAQHVRTYPFCIILVDEFEKMDAEARNIMLSVLDGSLTDEYGNPVSTTLALVLATTNAGDLAAKDFIERNRDRLSEVELVDQVSEIFEKALDSVFSPPILGRMDIIYPYRPLTPTELRSLVTDYLNSPEALAAPSIRTRFLAMGFDLTFAPSAIEYIAANYASLQLGARRLTAQIEQKLVREFLAPAQLRGTLRRGVPHVIEVLDGQFQFREATGKRR